MRDDANDNTRIQKLYQVLVTMTRERCTLCLLYIYILCVRAFDESRVGGKKCNLTDIKTLIDGKKTNKRFN